MSVKTGTYKRAFVWCDRYVQIPTAVENVSMTLRIVGYDGYGLLLTLVDAVGNVSWQESLTGLETHEVQNDIMPNCPHAGVPKGCTCPLCGRTVDKS